MVKAPVSRRRFLKPEELRSAVLAMVKDGAWSEATPEHFVELHRALHERVYGVECEELGGKSAGFARRMATGLIAKSFDGNNALFAKYMQWIWSRENGREQWRRQQGRDGGALSWQVVFGRRGIDDFKIAMAREQARKR